ncbi:MAG: polysaccharide deacetylase family protein [Candidatus Sulfotelmatobacter sp.]
MSPILKRVVYPWLANSGYLRRRAVSRSLCVVTYHGILPEAYEVSDSEQDGSLVSWQNFRDQLRMLKQCYQVVSPEQVRDWVVDGKDLPDLAVLLTCDDGLRNVLTDMTPILREEGLSCLFFVLGASARGESQTLWYEDLYLFLLAAPAGTYSFETLQMRVNLRDRSQRRFAWWNLVRKLSQCGQSARERFIETCRIQFGLTGQQKAGCTNNEAQRQRFSLLNGNELRQLAEQGMSIGSHTVNHPVLSLQASEMAWKEISESRGILQNAIGRPVWALAYPFGNSAAVTPREMEMAEQAGFQCAFMNIDGGFGAQLPKFALPRVHVTADMSLSEFEAHVSGFHRDLRSRLSRNVA